MKLVRRAAALVSAALLISSVAGPASAAPDRAGADWISRQVDHGLVTYSEWDFTDYGGTSDAAVALKAIGHHKADLAAIAKTLSSHVGEWTASGGDVNAGSTAKALLAALVTGSDPHDFGGTDLVSQLEGRVSSAAPIVGRLEDQGENDYVNTYSQAIAARGLARTGSPAAADVIDFLLQQQCDAGFFRLYFTADKTADDQSCDGGDPATESAPDTDATALAVLNLAALPKSARTEAITAAEKAAVRWLKKSQKDNGSFGGGVSTPGANADSTGLAGWALGVTGSCKAASKAASWVRKLQVRGDVPKKLERHKGAIAKDRAGFKRAKKDGIADDGTRYEWRKATFDAAPALSYLTCG